MENIRKVDNWKFLRDKLDFSDPSKFYMVQLQQRKKDDETFPANNRTVKTYFIGSIEEYDALEPEIKRLSDETKSRVYIRLNRRSYEDVALEANKELAQILKDKNFQHLKNLVPSSAGKICSEEDRLWIIDIDADNPVELSVKSTKVINFLVKNFGITHEYAVITLNGLHIITKKFNTLLFSAEFPDIDIHKDNPTLLYFNPDASRSNKSTE